MLKRAKKVFWPAFRCAQHLKSGRNTQQIVIRSNALQHIALDRTYNAITQSSSIWMFPHGDAYMGLWRIWHPYTWATLEGLSPGVKTFKLLWQCITELDPFLKKPENNVLLLLLKNYNPRFWRSWLLELRSHLFILRRFRTYLFG